MQLAFVNFVQIAISSASVFAALLLLPRRNTQALATLLAVFGLHMALNFAEETGLVTSGLLITPALSLLYGPLLYLLIRGLILRDGFLSSRDLIHFVPFAVAVFLTHWLSLVRVVTLVSLMVYSFACVRNIWVYHRATRMQRSDAAALQMNWVIAVFAGFGGLMVLDVARMLSSKYQSVEFQQITYALSLSLIACLFGGLSYFAINRPRFFMGFTDDEFRFVNSETVAGYEATEDDLKAFAAIENTIKDGQLHRRAHLTLTDLALSTAYAERDVSRLINLVGKKNFCDYINSLRVEDAAKMLASDKSGKRTILDYAFESGFSSKSSFNAAFKRQMSMTPSEYRRRESQA